MPRVLTFENAIADAERRCDEVSVLLGNGFSIDYDPATFRYDSLAEEAQLSGLSLSKPELFRTLRSSNFEIAIEKLNAAADLLTLYGGDATLAETLRADAKVVRNGLADVVASRHPESAQDLSDEEVTYARGFLKNFRRIFTLSYDLLLYWVVNRDGSAHFGVPKADGFEYPTARDRSKLVWKSKPSVGPQRVFHLHGALHYFSENVTVNGQMNKRVVKISTGGRIVSILRRRLNLGHYPVVVTEGRSDEKKARIDKSAYLRTGLRRFGELRGGLFIHGVSMSHNDDHIWELIEADTSEVNALYVGLHNPTSKGAREVIERAEQIKKTRKINGGAPLKLKFYDSDTAQVWRDRP